MKKYFTKQNIAIFIGGMIFAGTVWGVKTIALGKGLLTKAKETAGV